MSEAKHTPGTWSMNPIWPDRPVPVAGFCMSHFSKGSGGEEAAANANLIAAAPELLEALNEVIRTCKAECPAGETAIDMARTVIAKAEGRSR